MRLSQENSQGLEVDMVFSGNISTCGWRHENYSRYGEEILRHLSLFWLYDLLTGLDEIAVV